MVKKIAVSRRHEAVQRFAGHVPTHQILSLKSRKTIPSNH